MNRRSPPPKLGPRLRGVFQRPPSRREFLWRFGGGLGGIALTHLLGAQGAIGRAGGEIARAPSLPIDVVDTTGAGDSFDAGFVYGYLAGWDLARVLRLACVCGSLSTRAAGGTAAQATLVEALAAL